MKTLRVSAADRPPALKRRKLSEEVVRHIETAISSGEYGLGDRLPSERDFMAFFGVGRPSIREALFALRRMGLVELKTGERARVIAPTAGILVTELSGIVHHLLATPDGMRSFQQARCIFEAALAEHAARSATDEDVKALRKALLANQRAQGHPQRFVETDIGFHFAIARIARNSVIAALHVGIAEWLADQRLTSIRTSGSVAAAFAAHTKIFDAIAAHDVMGAGDEMRKHLGEVEGYYWSAWDGVVPAAGV
jgi:DNA-binding FadR family transcriptional regulator